MSALARTAANSLRLAILLTLANGSLDAYTFMARGGVFANVQTANVIFVGIDVIDGFLTEINVTCPTGIRAIARLDGPDVAAMIWDVIEKKRGG